MLQSRLTTCFLGHHGHFFVKSVVEELEEALQSDFDRTAGERWRTDESLWVPYAYANFYAWNYAAKPKLSTEYYERLTDAGGVQSVQHMFETLLNPSNAHKWTWLCVNDLLSNFTQTIEAALTSGFERLYPTASAFEKDLYSSTNSWGV